MQKTQKNRNIKKIIRGLPVYDFRGIFVFLRGFFVFLGTKPFGLFLFLWGFLSLFFYGQF
jgi:hypothetical protein